MPRPRRPQLAGATHFFTVALANRRKYAAWVANHLPCACLHIQRWRAALLCLMGFIACTACSQQNTHEAGSGSHSTSVVVYNYTQEGVQAVYINGHRFSGSGSYSGGGKFSCCVMIPNKWRPEFQVELEWEMADYIKNGKRLTNKEVKNTDSEELTKLVVERHLSKKVKIEPYGNHGGDLQIIFLPNDEVKIYYFYAGPIHPAHPASHLGWPEDHEPKEH